MRIKATKIYTYAELSDSAKEKARDWLREAQAGDNYFAECATDDFRETLEAFGFDVDKKHGLSWSGFWSQDNGASFTGSWHASSFAPAKLLADRPAVWPEGSGGHACPANAELHRIAGEIAACAAAGLLSANVSGADRWGFHMRLESSDHGEPEYATAEAEAADSDRHAEQEETDERFTAAARDLATGFYKTLEAEWDYQNSDEQIAESIEANGYEFTEEGERA